MATAKRKRQDDAVSPDSKRQRDLLGVSYAQSPVATDVHRYESLSSTNIQHTELQRVQETATGWHAANNGLVSGAQASWYMQQHPGATSTVSASGVAVERNVLAEELGHQHREDADATSAMDLEEARSPLQDVQEDVEMHSEASYAPSDTHSDNQGQIDSQVDQLNGLSPQQLNELRQFFLALGGSATNG